MNNDGTISELEMERLVDDMKVLLGVSESESAPCCEKTRQYLYSQIDLHFRLYLYSIFLY